LSMKNSLWLLIEMGSGGIRALDGNKVLSFSLSRWTSEVWKTGNKLGRLAKSSVTVDFFVSVIVC
jgi:hypothetical protein